MLELDDLQHFLLIRTPALAARYEFLSFREPAAGRAWLAGILDKVGTGRMVEDGVGHDARWVTVAFTWNGLRALGVDEAALATFPEEFRQGMVARAPVIGDTGADVSAARAAGARAILVPNGTTRAEEVAAAPEVATNLDAAVDLVIGP